MQRDYSIDTGALALTAGTALYAVGFSTTSAVPLELVEFRIWSDSQVSGSLKAEIVTWTSDGTGTAYTLKKRNADAQMAAASTSAKYNYTVAPTGTITVLETLDFALPTGLYIQQMPLGRGLVIPVSTFWGIRLTSTTASPNAGVTGVIEE